MWKSALVCLTALMQFAGAADVRLPPSLKEQPTENIHYFKPASLITLPCVATGSGELTYEWKINGTNLDLQSGKISRPDPTVGTIVITRADESDNGYYQCYVSNEYGKAMSVKTRLVCAVLQDFDGGTTVTPHTLTQYMSGMLKCYAPRSVPNATYTWVVVRNVADTDFTKISTDHRKQIDRAGNLHFAWVDTEDAQNGKIYKCIAKNPISNKTTGGRYLQTVTVTPRDRPQPVTPNLLFRSFPEIVGLEGKSIRMRCFFTGYPEPTIEWSRTVGEVEVPYPRFNVSKYATAASIYNLQASDEGVYACTGTVADATNSQRTRLTIEAEPILIGQVKDINATNGDTVVIDCPVYAKPAPQYTWYRNTEELNISALPPKFSVSADLTNLTVTNVQKSYPDGGGQVGDTMVIQCNASNKHGYAYKQVYVNVLERTVFTQAPKDLVIDHQGDQASFYAQANTDPSTPLTYTWYFDGTRLVSGSKYVITEDGRNLTITDVEQSDAGEYRCEASNGVSTAIATAELKLRRPNNCATIIIVLALWSVCSTAVLLVIAVIYFCKRRQSNSNRQEAAHEQSMLCGRGGGAEGTDGDSLATYGSDMENPKQSLIALKTK